MKYLINLLPKSDSSATDKIIYFSLHYLRYILVITQFVAICVFFYRFKVDQDIVDLRDKLMQKQYIVQSTESMLQEIAVIDSKMRNVKQLLVEQEKLPSNYAFFLSSLPSGIHISQMRVSENSIDFQGTTADADNIQAFMSILEADGRFSLIELRGITKEDNIFLFNLYVEKLVQQ